MPPIGGIEEAGRAFRPQQSGWRAPVGSRREGSCISASDSWAATIDRNPAGHLWTAAEHFPRRKITNSIKAVASCNPPRATPEGVSESVPPCGTTVVRGVFWRRHGRLLGQNSLCNFAASQCGLGRQEKRSNSRRFPTSGRNQNLAKELFRFFGLAGLAYAGPAMPAPAGNHTCGLLYDSLQVRHGSGEIIQFQSALRLGGKKDRASPCEQ